MIMNDNEIKSMIESANQVVLDVRPSLAQGVDPFHLIMGEIAKLQDGDVLHLIVGFEPKPLYNVLGSRGYEHYTEETDNVYNVYFFKAGSLAPGNPEGATPKGQARNGEQATRNEFAPLPDKVVEIDVRGMEPPEPMMVILEKIHEIDEDTVLLVHHHREPMMLYEKLEELGWEAVANRIDENYYKVVITRKVN